MGVIKAYRAGWGTRRGYYTVSHREGWRGVGVARTFSVSFSALLLGLLLLVPTVRMWNDCGGSRLCITLGWIFWDNEETATDRPSDRPSVRPSSSYFAFCPPTTITYLWVGWRAWGIWLSMKQHYSSGGGGEEGRERKRARMKTGKNWYTGNKKSDYCVQREERQRRMCCGGEGVNTGMPQDIELKSRYHSLNC